MRMFYFTSLFSLDIPQNVNFVARPFSVTVYALSFTFRATLGSFSLTFTRRPMEPYIGALPSSCLSMPLMRSLLRVLNFCNSQCVAIRTKIAAHACQHQLDIFVTLRIALPNTADAGQMPDGCQRLDKLKLTLINPSRDHDDHWRSLFVIRFLFVSSSFPPSSLATYNTKRDQSRDGWLAAAAASAHCILHFLFTGGNVPVQGWMDGWGGEFSYRRF